MKLKLIFDWIEVTILLHHKYRKENIKGQICSIKKACHASGEGDRLQPNQTKISPILI